MSVPPAFAAAYPNVVARIPILEAGIAHGIGVPLSRKWVRDMAASFLRPRGGRPVTLLYTEGFRTGHSRYVRRGAFPAYHIADGVTTASAEAFGADPSSGISLGVPSESRLHLVVVAEVRAALNLTDEDVLKALGVTEDELTVVPDWKNRDALGRPSAYELPQLIGELAHSAVRDAILYPSARAKGGENLVVFTTHLAATGGQLRTTHPVTERDECLPPCP